MNEQPPVGKSPGFWSRVWNDPLYFFCGLMLSSILIFLMFFLIAGGNQNPSHLMLRVRLVVGIILGTGIVLGFLGMILSLIPPVRRLLTRLLPRRLFILACVITIIAFVYAEEDWRGWHALKQFENHWTAQGEKFGFLEIAPLPVPDDQNFALTPIVSGSYAMFMDKNGHEIYPRDTNVVNRLDMSVSGEDRLAKSPETGNWKKQDLTDLKLWQDYYQTLATKTNLFAVPSQPGSPAADVLLALAKYDSSIEELRQASQLPLSRFPLTYNKDEPASILLPHLAALKWVTSTLRLRASAELQNGESDKAFADVRLMLYLNGTIRTEPFLISHLVRFAMLDATLQPVYEGLAAHRWSDAQLATLDTDLARLDFLADYKQVMRGELAFGIAEIEWMRRERYFMGLNDTPDGQSSPLYLTLRLLPAGFFYQNELQIAKMNLEYLLPSVDLEKRIVSPDTAGQNQKTVLHDLAQHPYGSIFARLLVPSVFTSIKRFAQTQTQLDLARVAIALERYHLAHGEFPGSLDALTPQFLSTVPHDVINGEPLHYRRTEDGQFVLYSVGWNQTDDGGVVVLDQGSTPNVDPTKGDWVWKYPAH